MSWPDLSLIAAGVLAFAVFMYVLLDGFDLGVGMLFPFAASDHDRDLMMTSVAPVWDGNETWLVLGGGGLLALFPLAFAILMPAVYFPVLLMLAALIFRGVAFEFRFRTVRARAFWDWAFAGGSFATTVAQGLILGAFVRGIPVEGRQFVGTSWDWISPLGLLAAAGLVAGYTLMGALWLVIKTEDDLREWAQGIARVALWAVLATMAAVSGWIVLTEALIRERWLDPSLLIFLWPIPILTIGLAFLTRRWIDREREVAPFLGSVGLFAFGYLGLAVSLFPYVVPRAVTIRDAAAAPSSLVFILVGVVVMVPLILAYTAWTYWIFRGKVTHAAGYGAH